MAKVFIEESSLSAIGDAIRGKTGKTDLLPVADMPGAITGIETGIDTGDATATAADIRKSKTAYAKGAKITGTLSDATQATPSITVSSGGLITASATQTAGYVTAGTKSATKQLTVQAAKTVTPSASVQTAVASGRYTTGAVTVAAIPSSYVQLNFTVVGGTSQPSSPAANTIWVNTSTSITSWVFSAEQPTSPAAGMVWFNTGTSATAAFNALKTNNLTVYPTGCKQYVNGAWTEKVAKTYQGGAWKSWNFILLSDGVFKSGYEFELISNSGSAVTQNGVLILKDTSNNYPCWYTKQKIGAAAFKAIKIKVTGGYARYPVTFGLVSARKEHTNENKNIFDVASVVITPSGYNISAGTYSIDLSAVTSGEYYFGCTISGSSSITDNTYGKGGISVEDIEFN